MNSTQRRSLRLALGDLGFHRSSYTHDSGDGAYHEEWTTHNSNDRVEIAWDTRSE